MTIRFQADADLNEDIVNGVVRREPLLEFRTAASAALRFRSDLEVLEIVALENRVLVSHDWKTMPRHFAAFIETNQSPGLIVIPQKLDLLTAIEDLHLIWLATDAADWINRVVRLPL